MRCITQEAEALLGVKHPVLDKGSITLIDYMGGDQRVVDAARVSTKGAKVTSKDAGLIDYLMRHRHTSPFEQVLMTFHCKMPIFVARQWVRHRTARLNEFSGRYSEMPNECYVPQWNRVQRQGTVNKQGSKGEIALNDQKLITNQMHSEQQITHEHYRKYLELGVSRELSRINLPLSQYTEWFWNMDLHNLFHFIGLRFDNHSQYEIFEYAKIMWEMMKAVAPMCCAAYERNIMNGISLSKVELECVKEAIVRGGLATKMMEEKLSKTQRRELEIKMGVELGE